MGIKKTAPFPISLMLILLGLLLWFYHLSLRLYLVDLEKPLILETSFLLSLLITCAYEFKHSNWKHNIVACFSAGIYFTVGTWIAFALRLEYLDMITQARAVPELMLWIGHDLAAVVYAKYTGYGTCFAGGILMMRTCLDGISRILITRVFIPVEERLGACSCCGSMVEMAKHQKAAA